MPGAMADVALLLVAVGLLWKGAEWVVYASARMAARYGLSDVVIGMTVVAIGTSAPEMVVTLVAAIGGKPEISVGNVVGSNVFNLGFILGGCAVLRTIPTSSTLVRRDAMMLLLASVLLVTFFLEDLWFGTAGPRLERHEGVVMMLLLAGYVLYLFHRDDEGGDSEEVPEGKAGFWDYPLLLLGLACVIGGAHLLVNSAVLLARMMGISEWAIGITIVAGGTSLPELATSMAAVTRGHPGIVAGNLIGSDLFNMLGVLGLAASLQPLQIHGTALPSVVMMTGMVLLVMVFMRTGWRVTRAEGIFLMLLAIVRWSRDLAPGLWS
jgi:cation:H+ antiporter